MAAAVSDEFPDTLSMNQLVLELEKQQASFREDTSALIQESVKPLQTSVDALRETVNDFNGCLAAPESLAGENFERLTSTEKTVKSLQAQNNLPWKQVP